MDQADHLDVRDKHSRWLGRAACRQGSSGKRGVGEGWLFFLNIKSFQFQLAELGFCSLQATLSKLLPQIWDVYLQGAQVDI